VEDQLDSSVFTFAVDIVDEGPDAVVAAAADRAGVNGVSLAVAYHHARDILPHNPRRHLFFHEGGTVFFHPEMSRYGDLRPRPGELAAERDPLDELCTAAERRSIHARAWTVYLHNNRLGQAHPDCTPENAFGDRLLTELCPANPEVRRYAVALTADLARYPIRSIMAEALHFRTIEHGFHHERYFLDLGPTARFLLGLCFCSSCRDVARSEGIDAEGLRRVVGKMLLGWFEDGSGGHDPLDPVRLGRLAGGEMTGYLEARFRVVTSLVGEVQDVATAAGVRLTFSAHGGSAMGGRTQSADAADAAWILGVDLEGVSSVIDEFEVLGYAAETPRIASLLGDYEAAISARTDIAVALRPMWPDTATARDLAERVQLIAASGASRLDFYHYGLMPDRSIDWVGTAMSQVADR